MNTRLSALFALLFGGLIFLGGCSGGNPNISAAEDAIEDRNYDQAIQSAQAALETDSTNAEAYQLMARAYSQQASTAETPEEHLDLLQKARDAQDKAVEFDPSLRGDVKTSRQMTYVDEMNKGVEAFNTARESGDSTDYIQAAMYFGGANMIQPDSIDAHLNEAYARLNAGQRTEAISPLETYVSRADSVGENAYTILGQLYLTDDQTEKSITLLKEATEQYPENEEMQSLLLNAFNQMGDTERAMQAYRDQIEKNPNNAQFRYNYGSMLLNADRYDDAIEQLKKASEIRSDDAKIFYNLGAAHINKAAAIDDSITTIEDRAREADREVTSEEEAMLDDMVEQRRTQFSEAIPPLEKALQLSESGSQYRTDICRALFQSYVNTEQDQKAEQVQSCAGMDDADMGESGG